MIKVIKTARTWIYVSFLICNSNFVLADITSDTEKLLNWAESKYPEFFLDILLRRQTSNPGYIGFIREQVCMQV